MTETTPTSPESEPNPQPSTDGRSESGTGSPRTEAERSAGEELLEALESAGKTGTGTAGEDGEGAGEDPFANIPWRDLLQLAVVAADAWCDERGELGDKLRLKKWERTILVESTAQVAEKYLRGGVPIELVCAAGWGVALYTRWMILRELRKANGPRDLARSSTPDPESPVEYYDPLEESDAPGSSGPI